jgi:hypothetical protein
MTSSSDEVPSLNFSIYRGTFRGKKVDMPNLFICAVIIYSLYSHPCDKLYNINIQMAEAHVTRFCSQHQPG